jgi:alpha-beta hydrolase superfamily lysophospholipase
VGRAYRRDPLSCHYNTLRQGNEILNTLPQLPGLCENIHIPVLIVHGTDDKLVKPEGSFELLKHFGGHPKHLMYLPNCRHEPHNDWEKQEYFVSLQQWFKHRLQHRSEVVADAPTTRARQRELR